jgi:hypothetical protein
MYQEIKEWAYFVLKWRITTPPMKNPCPDISKVFLDR